MKIKKDILSSQYAQLYVSFSKQDVNQIWNTIPIVDKEELKEEQIKATFERVIEEEVYRARLIPIGERRYRYFMQPTKNKPLMVLVQFCTLPYEDFQMTLPKHINVSSLFKVNLSLLTEAAIRDVLISTGYYSIEDTEIVTATSEVDYDIEIVQDDQKMQTIPDQNVQLDNDFADFGPLLIGKKIGERVLIDQTHVETYAVIRSIRDYRAKELTDDIAKTIPLLDVKNRQQFVDKIDKIVRFTHAMQEGLNAIIIDVAKLMNLEVDDYALDHYISFYPGTPRSYGKDQIKEMIVYQYLILYVSSIQEEHMPKHVDMIAEMYDYYDLIDALDDEEYDYDRFMDRNLHELRVVEYFIDQNIIEDIF